MKKTVISFALALLLFVSFSVLASAQAAPAVGEQTTVVQLDDMTPPEQAETETPAAQEEDPAQPEETEATVAEESSAAPESGNTPYFIGAAIAVLVFIGVAFYCKSNGNKTF